MFFVEVLYDSLTEFWNLKLEKIYNFVAKRKEIFQFILKSPNNNDNNNTVHVHVVPESEHCYLHILKYRYYCKFINICEGFMRQNSPPSSNCKNLNTFKLNSCVPR